MNEEQLIDLVHAQKHIIENFIIPLEEECNKNGMTSVVTYIQFLKEELNNLRDFKNQVFLEDAGFYNKIVNMRIN